MSTQSTFHKALQNAKKYINDEFYTSLEDIQAELEKYKDVFKDKIIYCNCDDAYKSNFFSYFIQNFNKLKIKKLIATSFSDDASCGLFESYSFKIEIVKVKGDIDYNNKALMVESLLKCKENTKEIIKSDHDYRAGDFRSKECVQLLKQSDIIISNPPFSLFKEYFDLLIKFKKDFFIIGNMNAFCNKNIIPHFIKNEVFISSLKNGKFLQPNGKEVFLNFCVWFYNIKINRVFKDLKTTTLYYKNPSFYPFYNNFKNCININSVNEIPLDYEGLMGVPVSFIKYYNPNQFEILGIINESFSKDFNIKKNNKNNKNPVILLNGEEKVLYRRIIIKNKRPLKCTII
ncbi:hypothetical protein FMM58_03680 [Campylobacter sp. LR291e]|uniref:adenine-specific methyltransferase EcoRI family protein n=1 Tax=Campylobacter sp. LR291e TaxID=2593546 RepID=UPI00123C1F63|nr:adenine-specific methyltransferase EcoRI family protein [Campylobacter sp. LR291e]KAA6231224.1 hypothetical protein FMM58_03680 [Campylobacter sp. LR291e]